MLSSLSIARRLALGFAAFIAAMAAIAGVALWAEARLGSAHRQLSDDALPQLAAADAVQAAASDMHFGQTLYVLNDGLSRGDYLSDRATFGAKMRSLARRARTPEERRALAAIRAAAARFQSIDARLYALVQAHRHQDAVDLAVGEQDDAADRLDTAVGRFHALAERERRAADDRFASARASSLVVTGVLVAVGLALAAAFAVTLARRLRRGLAQLLAAADGIAEGDVDQVVHVRGRDELAAAARAFARMVDYLKEVAGAARRVADGDLTVEIAPRSERDLLGTAFARMVGSLRGVVGQVGSTANAVAAASQQMASTSEQAGAAVDEVATAVADMACGADRQVRIVQTARGTTEEVVAAMLQSADLARQAAEVAGRAHEIAREGVQAAEVATGAMGGVRSSSAEVGSAIRDLAGKSSQIEAIVETITGIAGQTNLLALNAAIEAARAGDHGRGFAVVADEVRKLAEDSQDAAAQIAAIVQDIQRDTQRVVSVVEEGARRTEDGASTVDQTRDAFLRIGDSVEEVTARVREIAGAAERVAAEALRMQESVAEVAAVAEQSSASTQQVSASTQETSAAAQEIAASARRLASDAEALTGLVATFRTAA